MDDRPVHILLVEDDVAHAMLVERAFELQSEGVRLSVARSLSEARIYLERQTMPPDLVIADWRLPDGEGLELLAPISQQRIIPTVIMTSHGNERVAVEAMKFGAIDYVVKSELTLLEMPHIATRALRQWQNIVERKRAEEALRESEARYRLITENANDMISLLDKDGVILYLSPSVRSLLDYEPDNLLGTPAFDLLHPEDLEHVRERWAQLDLQRRAQVTYRIRHRNGSWRWFDMQGTIIEQQGQRYTVSVSRDITDRRELEAQLFQAQKLDAIGQLASGVAHDFNNLLAVILSCAALAGTTLDPDNPARHELNEIQRAAQRATSLTRQLLTFARRQVSEPALLNLNDLIREIDRMLRRLLREDMNLVSDLAPELWQIWADPGQIEQVIMNLALNGRDAMPCGGRLTITTANRAIEEMAIASSMAIPPGSYVLISVADTGAGMSAEVQRHAFEPFFTTKEPGQGTGLGLATCYGIVKQHGGAIYLSSEIGRGTTVDVYLPRAQNGPLSAAGSERATSIADTTLNMDQER